ncbi:MAG: butyrate kinase [Prevotella sp.]|nr:butyrate kinase [Prevotella sp.]
MKILVINPGSTSTKIAVYEDHHPVFTKGLHHSREELSQFAHVNDQYEFRRDLVTAALHENHIPLDFDAIVSRGGLGKPIPGGAYAINDRMIADNFSTHHHHPCNLGCKIALELSQQIPGCIAVTADPGVVDELMPVARVTGLPEMERECFWHALNQRAVGRRFAREQGKRYEDMNLIICHLGGGVSIAAHQHGRAVDVNNALDGEGPFSTERTGSLPSSTLVRLCFSGKYSEEQLLRFITGEGGLFAYLGTNDLREVMQRVDAGDERARFLVEAMIFNIAKGICAERAVFCDDLDAIILTGGMAHNSFLVDRLLERIRSIAPVHIYPGEDEMSALADDALAVLRGERVAQEYV